MLGRWMEGWTGSGKSSIRTRMDYGWASHGGHLGFGVGDSNFSLKISKQSLWALALKSEFLIIAQGTLSRHLFRFRLIGGVEKKRGLESDRDRANPRLLL